jgi:Zinc-binding/Small EDRK-rich factor 1/2-like, N-terminal
VLVDLPESESDWLGFRQPHTPKQQADTSKMGRTNACRAQQKRERNAKKAGKASGKSNLASNKKALATTCTVCRSSFMCTVKKPMLETHRAERHEKKTFAECFPMWTD